MMSFAVPEISVSSERTTMKESHYTMIIQWDDDDKIFVVSVPELPGCMTHGETYEEAVKQGKEAIEGWLDVAKAWGGQFPNRE
jgi:predicted RNase H-like HicB family nuclease